jgi:PHD/YefM family antitoxin component YafN of YafNO toxin-antitoxin module
MSETPARRIVRRTSTADLESLEETIELLSGPAAQARIAQSNSDCS